MGQSVRSLAAEVGIPVNECVHQLRVAGLKVAVGGQRLEAHALTTARQALDLTRHRFSVSPSDGTARTFGEGEMLIRLLRPLREKGKVGREHTTAIEHVWGHGVPDHLKAEAKRMVEALLAEGCLAEKVSQRRRHVWLTTEGQARLLRAEEAMAADRP